MGKWGEDRGWMHAHPALSDAHTVSYAHTLDVEVGE
jgi:hypothetical protein